MANKEFKKLNKAELLEVIYRFQLREQALTEELEHWKAQAHERYKKLASSGNLAEAALSIHNVISSAQQAADDYVSEVTARINAKEQKAQAALLELRSITHSIEDLLKQLEDDSPVLENCRRHLAQVLDTLSIGE